MAAAWALFAEHGFEATTVDQIADAAGMSRRSFFRYFTGKEELLESRLRESERAMVEALRARPEGEPAWTALRNALRPVAQAHEVHPDRARALLRMVREPALRSLLWRRHRSWQEAVAPLLAERMGSPAGDPGPPAIAAAALSCLEAAQDAWIDAPGAHLADLLDGAMDAVGALA